MADRFMLSLAEHILQMRSSMWAAHCFAVTVKECDARCDICPPTFSYTTFVSYVRGLHNDALQCSSV